MAGFAAAREASPTARPRAGLGIVPLLVAAAACSGERAGDAPEAMGEATAGQAARVAFFDHVAELCGRSFPGRAVFSATDGDPMLEAPLAMHVATCEPGRIRIPFQVGEDRSRTWILTLSGTELLFKHDHRHEDGTPDEITDYGGWATEGGSPTRQSFPADEATAALIPEAATNVWTLEVDRDSGLFIYDLQRHARPRFRAEFDMTGAEAGAG